MATFTPIPDNGCGYDRKPNVRVVNYGDGYEQRQANGLNSSPKKWNLKFSARTDAEASVIVDFLSARNAVESFDWVDPFGVSGGKYVCRSWARTRDAYNVNTITAVFEQVFEP